MRVAFVSRYLSLQHGGREGGGGEVVSPLKHLRSSPGQGEEEREEEEEEHLHHGVASLQLHRQKIKCSVDLPQYKLEALILTG